VQQVEHEQVVIGRDEPSGLVAVVAIHSTALGPALGGTRMRPYPDLAAAIDEALELSRAMTAKNALAGLDHGGGKAVIVGDPATVKTPELLLAYGRLVASLGGRYVTACDVGTYVADMDIVHEVNPWTTGRSPARGGAGDSGIMTALGVHAAMRACAEQAWGSPSLAGRRIGIEGLGKVGARLAALAVADGAEVFASDVDERAVQRVRAEHPQLTVLDRAALLTAPLDVLAPCALGGTLSASVVESLRCAVVCGGANNQFAGPGVDLALADRGILHAPDFVANGGGVIAVAAELPGYRQDLVTEGVLAIGATTRRVLARASADAVTPWAAALAMAAERVDAGSATPFRTFPAPVPHRSVEPGANSERGQRGG
jgi:valine dehydrogenase (NAD+)